MFRDFLKKQFYENPPKTREDEETVPVKKKRAGFSPFDISRPRATVDKVTPEAVEHMIDTIELPIECNLITFTEEQSARPCPIHQRVIEAFPEAEEQIQPVYDALMSRGGLLGYGKLFRGYEEAGDFQLLFAGGGFKTFHREAGKLKNALPLQKYASPFFDISGQLIEDEYPDADAHAGIFSHLMTKDDIETLASGQDDPLTLAALESLNEIAMSDEDQEVMVFIHSFISDSRNRGHLTPIRMTYCLPGSIGKTFEQEIGENPWLIEALSEKVTEGATEELDQKEFADYGFLNDSDEYLNGLRMFAPSRTGHIKFLASFYNKD